MTRALTSGALLVVGVAATGAASCAATGSDAQQPEQAGDKRATEMTHEPCDLSSSSVKTWDADVNGRPEIIAVMAGARELCRAVDLDRDGTVDAFSYSDEQGRERRRELGLEPNGRPNEIQIFEAGVLVRKERETNNDGQLDTWDYYEQGLLVREERDSNGDGYIDAWWTFPRPGDQSCAVVLSDLNGDGKPDPDSKVETCEGATAASASPDAGAPPSAPTAAASPTAPAPSATPAPTSSGSPASSASYGE